MRALRPLLSALLLIAFGCTDEVDPFDDGFGDDELIVEQPGADPINCGSVGGGFTADALDFIALDDSGLFEDFGGVPDFTSDFDFDTNTFTSTLTVDDIVTTSTGTFTVIGDDIVFSGPFVPGMADAPTALGCDFDGTNLTLFGETDFDFEGDDVDPIGADFTGVFTSSFGQGAVSAEIR